MSYNLRSPSVKRIMREAEELSQPTDQYYAAPLEENLFEWHFTIKGPADTPFEGGLYHGRIQLPAEYPLKPPNIIMLTPNGRFETGKKICLSISAYHPETWQPSWSIRTVLIALIGFLPTKGEGAVAALDYTAQERRDLAQKSVNWVCPICGQANRTALQGGVSHTLTQEDKDALAQLTFKGEDPKAAAAAAAAKASASPLPASSNTEAAVPAAAGAAAGAEATPSAEAAVPTPSASSTASATAALPAAAAAPAPAPAPTPARAQAVANNNNNSTRQIDFFIFAIVMAILALLWKRMS
eukprot:m.76871 g.76871  ORF g.76871 m.76871 type:complete len:298 (+) comp14667_c0_seq1:294-1187(+)